MLNTTLAYAYILAALCIAAIRFRDLYIVWACAAFAIVSAFDATYADSELQLGELHYLITSGFDLFLVMLLASHYSLRYRALVLITICSILHTYLCYIDCVQGMYYLYDSYGAVKHLATVAQLMSIVQMRPLDGTINVHKRGYSFLSRVRCVLIGQGGSRG